MLYRKYYVICNFTVDIGFYRYTTNFYDSNGAVAFVLICIYAPAATLKQPIPNHMKKEKIMVISITVILLIGSFFIPQPFNELVQLGIVLIGAAQLPIFFQNNRKDEI